MLPSALKLGACACIEWLVDTPVLGACCTWSSGPVLADAEDCPRDRGGLAPRCPDAWRWYQGFPATPLVLEMTGMLDAWGTGWSRFQISSFSGICDAEIRAPDMCADGAATDSATESVMVLWSLRVAAPSECWKLYALSLIHI